jgi:ABC-type iron transport system FetAB ATPase subunit
LGKLGFEKDVLEWRVDRLSTGEKQRLALFRLLLNEPKVLLLDEPTAALDSLNVGLVEDVISNVRKTSGAAVVWVSHSPEQIARVADRHLEFRNGGLEAAQ